MYTGIIMIKHVFIKPDVQGECVLSESKAYTNANHHVYCARAQLISQHVDAGQLNVPPQQRPIILSLTRVMLN